VPFPFDCLFAGKVDDYKEAEKIIHKAFDPNRPNKKREFFTIDPEQAIVILRHISTEDVTPAVAAEIKLNEKVSAEEEAASQNYKNRKPHLNFREMGIPEGATLVFTHKGAEKEEAIVFSDKTVKARGSNEEVSLTALTKKILKTDTPISPKVYWSYNGKSLDDIYKETYY